MLQSEDSNNRCTYLNNVQVLIYENELLKQRNRVLASENEKLLNQIQEIYINKRKTVQKSYRNQKQTMIMSTNFQKEKEIIIKIAKLLENRFDQKQLGKMKVIHEMVVKGCATFNLLQTILQIIENCDQKQNAKNSNIHRLQMLVQRRKEKIKTKGSNDREVVHLVKEPALIETGIIQLDFEYVLIMAEKIAGRVKRKQIAMSEISRVFGEVMNFIALRRSIRKQEKTLKIMERQLELGVGSRNNFSELSNRLLEKSEKQLIKRQEIEEMISKLSK